MHESIMVPLEGEHALEAVSESLIKAGLRVTRSFDLRSAMAAQGECECPDHGTAACTCQFAVLLAYPSPVGPPLVITAHSSGPRTDVSLVEEAGREPDAEAAEKAMEAVMGIVEMASIDTEVGLAGGRDSNEEGSR
jgi:hypothetical protein